LHEFGDGVRPLPQFTDGRLNILFLGRMDDRKGFPYLLNAFSIVQQRIPSARLVVAGGYTEDDIAPYRRQVAEQNVRDVVFVGRVADADKPRYYKSCHVFCAPSTGFESQGIVLLEAMAAGRALVASDIPGYRSVISDGQEGLLVPPRDEEKLAAALIGLLESPDLRAQLGQCGLQRVQRHSWVRVSSEILDYYEEIRHRQMRRGRLREVLCAR
jgi:phosphatidylinositol alpha-mannosyltransferase